MTAKKKRSTKTSPPAKKSPAGQASATPPAPASHARPAKAAAPTRGASKEKKYSALEAAAQVLRETGQAMTCPELIAQMAAKGYWSSPKGKTPASTLYAAMTREIKLKGAAARFHKTGRGSFACRAPRTPRS